MAQKNFGLGDNNASYGIGNAGFGLNGFSFGFGATDLVYLDASRSGPVQRNLGAGDDLVFINSNNGGQVRLTFTSSEVGNGNPNDSNTMANQDGGLAVRLQLEDGSDMLMGPISRFDDEGVTFTSVRNNLTFDVRDLVAGTQRGDQFEVVRLGTEKSERLFALQQHRPYYINAGMGDDMVTGGRANDFLVGGGGNDTLDGRGGDDSLLGGGGDDTARFNVSTDGADITDLGAGNDTVLVDADHPGQVRLTFTSADVGNAAPLDGNNAANEDGGLAVRLQLEGQDGNPNGPLSRFDDEGITFVSQKPGLTFDVRDLVAGTQRGNQFEVVRLGTEQADNLDAVQANRPYYINAGMGDDTVTGGQANDFLVGGGGNDTLDGRGGHDMLLGGGGQDTFLFTSPLDGFNMDSIVDFNVADDTIQLSAVVFQGLPTGNLMAEAFALSTAQPAQGGRISYDQGTGVLAFDADGSGSQSAVAFATLGNKPTDLSAADFVVVA